MSGYRSFSVESIGQATATARWVATVISIPTWLQPQPELRASKPQPKPPE